MTDTIYTFEKNLNILLKAESIKYDGLKHTKNKLTYKSKTGEGILSFFYLKKVNGYLMTVYCDNYELKSFIEEQSPPYNSRIPSGQLFIFNSHNEAWNGYSDTHDGVVVIPNHEQEFATAGEKLCAMVFEKYLPRVINICNCTPNLIDDVCANKDYYAYPFLTIAFAGYKNKITELNNEIWNNKKIYGNKQFDLSIAVKYGLQIPL